MPASAKRLEGKHVPSATWPQVFIGGKLIGSADDLEAYLDARKAA